MDPLEKAKKLQAERIEKERLDKERLDTANRIAREVAQKNSAISLQKTEELLPLFRQFTGFKIADGKVTIDSGLSDAREQSPCAVLKVETVGTSVMDRFFSGMLLLAAKWDSDISSYKLDRLYYAKTSGYSIRHIGSYKTSDQLLDATASEIAKM